MKKHRTSQRCGKSFPAKGAFTLIELLVVIAVIAILAALLLPLLNQSQQTAQSAACLNNLRQLEMSCHVYSMDYNDFLPPNEPGGFVSGIDASNAMTDTTNYSWCPGIAPTDMTVANVERGLIYPYINQPAIYHCPSDLSTVTGYPTLLRTRSYTMDISLSCTNATESTFMKYTDIRQPSPANLFVLIDEQPQVILDATFGIFDAPTEYWMDVPADRHDQGASLSFADGHVEHWHWSARKIFIDEEYYVAPYSADDLADLQRLQQYIKPGLN